MSTVRMSGTYGCVFETLFLIKPPRRKRPPFLQVALDAIVNPNRNMSAAGGLALQSMSSFVGSLDQDTLKHFFKLLSTENFQSKHFLLQACASWDPAKERGGGFIMRGLDTLLPAIGALVGMPKSASKAGATLRNIPRALQAPAASAASQTRSGSCASAPPKRCWHSAA